MSLFKNLIPFRIGPEWVAPDPQALEAELQRLAFQPCGATQELSVGWLPPRGEEHVAVETTPIRDDQGNIVYFKDIYGRDRAIENARTTTLVAQR